MVSVGKCSRSVLQCGGFKGGERRPSEKMLHRTVQKQRMEEKLKDPTGRVYKGSWN